MSDDLEDDLRRTLSAKADQVVGHEVGPPDAAPAPAGSRVLVSVAAAAIVLVSLVGGLVLLTRSGDESEAPIAEVPSTTTVPGPNVPTTTAVGVDDPTPDLPGVPWDAHPYAGAEFAVVGVAADDVLNVRTGPGVEFDVAYTLGPLEDSVIATGQNRQLPSGDVWALVRQGAREGWVNAAYLLLPSSTEDVTASNFPSPADLPRASTVEDLAHLVADAVAGGDSGPRVTIVDGPHAGDLYEVTVDVIGLGDDSAGGYRLHLFAVREGDGPFLLRTVESTVLCSRGVSDGGCL